MPNETGHSWNKNNNFFTTNDKTEPKLESHGYMCKCTQMNNTMTKLDGQGMKKNEIEEIDHSTLPGEESRRLDSALSLYCLHCKIYKCEHCQFNCLKSHPCYLDSVKNHLA